MYKDTRPTVANIFSAFLGAFFSNSCPRQFGFVDMLIVWYRSICYLLCTTGVVTIRINLNKSFTELCENLGQFLTLDSTEKSVQTTVKVLFKYCDFMRKQVFTVHYIHICTYILQSHAHDFFSTPGIAPKTSRTKMQLVNHKRILEWRCW